jgi:hypothetical protein
MDEQVRVKFGPLDNQDIPLEWAERMLADLFSTHPVRFGDLLKKIVIGSAK